MSSWKMPAEWQKHEKTWMAWPSSGYTLGDTDAEKLAARTVWSSVANAVVRFEPVSMLCEYRDIDVARDFLDDSVELIACELNDAWMRDIGPTFVKNDAGEIAGVNWVFNGWGAQEWASWDKDDQVAKVIVDIEKLGRHDSKLINEGGGIHVNGNGVVLLTETVQLGEGRNSNWSKQEVEAEIHAQLGTDRAIWLRRGLTRDYDEFGTRGHVDIVACFANEDTILYHEQTDEAHPDFSISKEVRRTLEEAGSFNLVAVPAPKILRDEEGFVDYSYINHYIVNGAVILCAFDDPNDKVAAEILAEVYPGREIILVDARELFARGGGIHCITQQQPA